MERGRKRRKKGIREEGKDGGKKRAKYGEWGQKKG